MTAADVPTMLGGDILPLLWHPRATAPEYRRELFQLPQCPGALSAVPKPTGGLWTSPPAIDADGRTVSAFEAWRRHNGLPVEPSWLPPRRVIAHPLATIGIITERGHWDALYQAYPEKARTDELGALAYQYLREERLDWAALAASGSLQAVALAGAAIAWANTSLTSLAAWDAPTVYWLDPEAFAVV